MVVSFSVFFHPIQSIGRIRLVLTLCSQDARSFLVSFDHQQKHYEHAAAASRDENKRGKIKSAFFHQLDDRLRLTGYRGSPWY